MQGTAEFHRQITDTLFPETDTIFDDATALHTAVHVLNPKPAVMESLIGPLLL